MRSTAQPTSGQRTSGQRTSGQRTSGPPASFLRALVVLACGLAVCCLAACGNPDSDPLHDDSGHGGTSGKGARKAEKTSITVYTSEPDEDIAKLVKAFGKRHSDIEVDVFRSGTEEVLGKLRAEKKAGAQKADVVFIADSLSMESLKADHMLATYTSPEASDIDPAYVDPQGMYTGTKLITTGIAINTDKVKTKPTSWEALTDSDNSGSVVMPSPLYSGAAAYNVAVLADDPDFGWEFWSALAGNDVSVVKGNGSVLEDVASGRKSMGMVVDFIVGRSAAQGSPVAFVYPKEGVPAITEPIALTRASKHPKAAKEFIDFVLSKPGQKVASRLGYVPIRADAPVPNGLKGISDLKVIGNDEDPRGLASKIGKVKKRFAQLVGS